LYSTMCQLEPFGRKKTQKGTSAETKQNCKAKSHLTRNKGLGVVGGGGTLFEMGAVAQRGRIKARNVEAKTPDRGKPP